MASYGILRIDGNFGTVTKKAFQAYLHGRGYYTGLIDGDFGSMSIKALQRFLSKNHGAMIPYTGLIDGVAGNRTWDGLAMLMAYMGYWQTKPTPWPSGQTPYNWSGFTRIIQEWLNGMR